MLKKQDQEFQALLDDPVNLEKRLQELGRARRANTITAAVLSTLTCGHVLWLLATYNGSISAKNPFGMQIPPPMMLMPVMFLLVLLINAIKAVAAHCELRTLLLFKKLRNTKSVTTP